jgi:hypothetical protein
MQPLLAEVDNEKRGNSNAVIKIIGEIEKTSGIVMQLPCL